MSYYFIGQSISASGGSVNPATSFAGVTISPNTGTINWAGSTVLSAPANGTLAVSTSTGTFGSLLLGAASSSTGVLLVATNQTLTLQGGGGVQASNTGFSAGMVTATNTMTATNHVFSGSTSTAAAPWLVNGTSTNTGLYFPTTTTLGLSTNGTAALTFTAAQAATFTASVTIGNFATVSAPAGVKGTLYFDTTLNKLRVYTGSAYETITSS
jgi:hypothetical protein